jgi:hypothetical protein
MSCSFDPKNLTYDGKPQACCNDDLLRIAKGEIPGHTPIRKYGEATFNAATGWRTVWQYGGVTWGDLDYTFPEDGTAPIDSISSSSAADTGTVRIEGLDINGYWVIQDATLQGQTRVALTTSLWRCFRAYNTVATTTPTVGSGFAGQIYIYINTAISGGVPTDKTKVKTFVNNGDNQTLQAFYTIPKGYYGIVYWARSSIVTKVSAAASMRAYARPYGLNFLLKDSGCINSTGTSVFQENRTLLGSAPELTDFVAYADVSANSTTISSRFDILLYKIGY